MSEMGDAFDVARALDGRLVELGDEAYADEVVAAFAEALYDYRGDGNLDRYVERCQEVLDEAGGVLNGDPVEGRCFRALDSLFSSG